MGNIRLANSYVPQVSDQVVPQPSIPANTGQALPQAIGQFAGALDNFHRVEQANEDKEQNFEAQKAYLDEATALPGVLQEAQNAAPPNAIDFGKTTDEMLKKRHDELLSTYAGKLTPEALQNLDLKFTDLRRAAASASTKFATDSHNSYLSVQTGDAADKLGKMVFSQPEMLESSLQEFRKLVDSLPELDAPTKEKLYQDTKTQMALLAGMGLAERDPKSVVGSLTPGGRTYNATPARVALINSTWTAAGVPPQWGFDFAKLESDVGRNQATSGEDNQGLFQLGPEERKGSNGADEATNSKLAAELTARNVQTFKAKFNRMPTETEAYLMHQQGTAGGLAIAGAPNDKPAWEVLRPFYPSTRSDAYVKTAVAQGGILSPDATVGQVKALWASKIGDSGNPVLDHLNGPQQMQVLNAAQANVDRKQTQDRTQLTVDTNNAKDVLLSGQDWTGPAITQQRYADAYGDIQGAQMYADYVGVQKQGQFIKSSATMNGDQIDAAVQALKPTNPMSSTFHEDTQSYDAAIAAQKLITTQRHDDAAAYVMQNYPAVKQTFAAMQDPKAPPEARQAFYASLSHAYEQLGIPEADQKAFTSSTAAQLKTKLDAASPEDRVSILAQLGKDTGPLFERALDQLVKDGHFKESYEAGGIAADPNLMQVFADAERGLAKVDPTKGNSSLRPSQDKIDQAFNTYMDHKTLPFLSGSSQRAIKDLAMGLYVERGGDPAKDPATILDKSIWEGSLRAVMGGNFSDDTTGAVDLGKGLARYKTILPPGTDTKTWGAMIDNINPAFLSQNANGTPYYGTGMEAPPDDIKREGVFVRVGPDQYQVYMGSDNSPLMTKQGQVYTIRLPADVVHVAATTPTKPLTFPGSPSITSTNTDGQDATLLKNFLDGPPADKAAQMSDRIRQVDQQMGLTPQEKYLYQHHLQELAKGGVAVKGESAATTRATVKQITVQMDGLYYNLPTVWNGNTVSTEKAIELAKKDGLDKYPHYAFQDQADERYNYMHPFMDEDVAAYLGYPGGK